MLSVRFLLNKTGLFYITHIYLYTVNYNIESDIGNKNRCNRILKVGLVFYMSVYCIHIYNIYINENLLGYVIKGKYSKTKAYFLFNTFRV